MPPVCDAAYAGTGGRMTADMRPRQGSAPPDTASDSLSGEHNLRTIVRLYEGTCGKAAPEAISES